MPRLKHVVAGSAARLALRWSPETERRRELLAAQQTDLVSDPPRETAATAARVAILVGFIVALPIILLFALSDLTPADNVLIVLASWTAGAVAEILVELIHRFRLVHADVRRDARTWMPLTDFDHVLIELRKSYLAIERDHRPRPDLFASYYENRLRHLSQQMTMSASSKVLRVNQTHFDTTDILMTCLAGGSTDDFLATHLLSNNDYVRNVPHARRYMTRFEQKLRDGDVKAVRRLFVADDTQLRDQLTDEFTIYFIALHASEHTQFDYRILPASTYRQFLADHEPDAGLVEDFGIYGEHYVYETNTASAQSIQGSFSADRERVQLYRRHFDACWEAGHKYEYFLPSAQLPDVRTTDDLFDPFTRAEHQPPPLRTHLAQSDEPEGSRALAANLNVQSISSTGGTAPVTGDASASISELLAANELCSVATVTADGRAHVHTCFFAFDLNPLRLWFLTPPSTEHGQNVTANPSTAIAVFSTSQAFESKKRGLQLFGATRRVPDDESGIPLEKYGARFPALLTALSTPGTLEGLESRFYEIIIERARVFDEPRFGSEVWVDVTLKV